MEEDKNIQFKKAISIFRKDAKIKECFHFDTACCSDKIIAAHSIQRNGVLSLVEDAVNGSSCVYSFLHLKYDEEGKVSQ